MGFLWVPARWLLPQATQPLKTTPYHMITCWAALRTRARQRISTRAHAHARTPTPLQTLQHNSCSKHAEGHWQS